LFRLYFLLLVFLILLNMIFWLLLLSEIQLHLLYLGILRDPSKSVDAPEEFGLEL
jgi:hypothetical protein